MHTITLCMCIIFTSLTWHYIQIHGVWSLDTESFLIFNVLVFGPYKSLVRSYKSNTGDTPGAELDQLDLGVRYKLEQSTTLNNKLMAITSYCISMILLF